MTNGKTFLENTIIFDKGLSLEAIGLYAILKHYSTISDFQIRRNHIKSVSGYGETSFRRVWKELKDSNLLLEHKKRINGKFEYEFTLSTSDRAIKEDNTPKKSTPKKVKTEEKVEILEGQVSIDDMSSVDSENSLQTDVQASESKELTLEEEIVKETSAPIEEVKEAVEYAKDNNARDITAYVKKCLENNWHKSKRAESKGINPLKFNNFEARQYDYDSLESQLLGHEESYISITDDMPIGIDWILNRNI